MVPLADGSSNGRAATKRKRSSKGRLPSLAERRQRREEAIESANRLLDLNSGKLMGAMIELATNEKYDERARGSVGMKLIDKLLPPKSSPLIQVNQQTQVNSHLGVPILETQKPIAGLEEPQKELIPSGRLIDVASLDRPSKPSYLPLKKGATIPTRLREPLPSSTDTTPDDSVVVTTVAEREPPQDPKPKSHPW